jgi:peptidoglycan/LPS O-acetylase OafA/YrhL
MMNGRIKGLDGIRGIAALAVFAVHYNQIVDINYQIGSIDFYQLIANGDHGVA